MRLRLMTYNIHKCVGGLDLRYDPGRVAEAIAQHRPEVVLLQEVCSPAAPDSKHEEQAELICARLGYGHFYYHPHIQRRGGFQYGNAILSMHPIVETHSIDLTIPPKKKRGAVHSRIKLHSSSGRQHTLHVYNLHLGLFGPERKLQLRKFLDCDPFARLHHDTPLVVAGDFNDFWGTLGTDILEPAGFRGPEKPPLTFPAFAPLRALDSLYVRGRVQLTHLQRAQTAVCRRASDHLPLVADLRLH